MNPSFPQKPTRCAAGGKVEKTRRIQRALSLTHRCFYQARQILPLTPQSSETGYPDLGAADNHVLLHAPLLQCHESDQTRYCETHPNPIFHHS